jgi:putative glutathione S-transferase
MTCALKGLDDTISTTVVHPVWQTTKPGVDEHRGWVFGNPDGEEFRNTNGKGGPFPPSYPGNDVEPFFGAKSVRDLYDKADDTDGKYSVPVLWDKKLNTIVSNESSEIIRMLNSEFNEFATNAELDLYPEDMVDDIEAANDWIYPALNNGVYRCGFAQTQGAYDEAIEELTEAFDKVDSILQKQRYIAGNEPTLADIRLFVTLVRFDEVYQGMYASMTLPITPVLARDRHLTVILFRIVYFKTNTRSVTHTPSILNYCREIYQMPGVADTVNMEQIKYHYFCSHVELNALSIVPRGNDFEELLKEPHDRDSM